jgi:hypothetical protein
VWFDIFIRVSGELTLHRRLVLTGLLLYTPELSCVGCGTVFG